MIRLRCFECGKAVSTEVPDDTLIRGLISCPECIEQQDECPEDCECVDCVNNRKAELDREFDEKKALGYV